MRLVPKSIGERIQFYKSRIAAFIANAAVIGLSPAEASDLEARIDAANAAYDEHLAAQQTAKAKTAALYCAMDALNVAGSAAIAKIRATAEITANPDVYALASIPLPSTPKAVGELGKPDDFKMAVDQTGALTITWKNRNPSSATGVVYQIRRRIGSSGEFEYIGAVGEKKYIDTTVPPGTAQVQYQVQAMRSSGVGPVALFIVNFGGGMKASVAQEAVAKIAA